MTVPVLPPVDDTVIVDLAWPAGKTGLCVSANFSLFCSYLNHYLIFYFGYLAIIVALEAVFATYVLQKSEISAFKCAFWT